MIATETGTCVNCGEPVTSPYCPKCGQKNPPRKITLLSLYHDFQSRIYGFDGMFPRTIRDLTIKPGEVARTYVSGNRVMYVGPVGYFFLMLTVFILVMGWLNIDFYTFSQSNNPWAPEQTKGAAAAGKFMSDIIARNMRIFFFIRIPIAGFFSWLFFRKAGYNWLENTILAFYTEGHMVWLSIINVFVFAFFEASYNFWVMPLSIFYYAYSCTGFFVHSGKLASFLKGIGVYILSLLVFVLLVIIAAVTYIIMNPEIRQMLRDAATQ